jgi:hypothetical protein
VWARRKLSVPFAQPVKKKFLNSYFIPDDWTEEVNKFCVTESRKLPVAS